MKPSNLTPEQFLFFKYCMLSSISCPKDLKNILLDESNYEFIDEKLLINSEIFWNKFQKELFNFVLSDIVETTYECDDYYVTRYNDIFKIKNRFFYCSRLPYNGEYDDNDDIQKFEEVFPIEIKIQSYKFLDGSLTNKNYKQIKN